MSKHTPGPWYVRDFRACKMGQLGWAGPAIDRILITNMNGREIEAASGANSVIARIQFDNRADLLTDGNLADATLIAAAPDLLMAIRDLQQWAIRAVGEGARSSRAIGRAQAAIAKALGE